MHKKAQALIIILWVLVILTILAVSVGHRVALALRLSRYQRDALRAYSLAKAGVSLAIERLTKDLTAYDGLNEDWATSDDLFKENKIFGADNGFVTVGYFSADSPEDFIYGVRDESGLIDINQSGKQVLKELFVEIGLDSTAADSLADEVLKWRGDIAPTDDEDSAYLATLGYKYKRDKFAVTQELLLLKGIADITAEGLEELKLMTTVYSGKLVNINTAPRSVLNVIARVAMQNVPGGATDADRQVLVSAIMNFRLNENYPIKALDAAAICTAIGLDPAGAPAKILNQMINDSMIDVKSSIFSISANATVNAVNKSISAVYNRAAATGKNPFLLWHQN